METAHGLGGAADLPIPASAAIAGGTVALVVSFVILLYAWRRPRFDVGMRGRPASPRLARAVDSRWWGTVWRGVGLAIFGFTWWAATAGEDSLANPTFGIVYVLLWVGLVPASLALGPVYRTLNPARTLYAGLTRLLGVDRANGAVRLPAWVGCWPAAVGLFTFVWLELVYPASTDLSTVRLWFTLHLCIVVFGAVIFGERWIAQADPFEVYSTLVSRLSVWARDDSGRLVVMSPLANLARVPVTPGLTAVVAVLLGSTAWDSFRGSPSWVRFVQSSALHGTLLNTAMLTVTVVVVAVTFVAATSAAPVDTSFLGGRRWNARRLAHSVVPIVVGYMTAHYLTFLVESGQLTIIRASDPLGHGWNLFGTANLEVDYWLSTHPSLLASAKVVAIVTGHIVGAVAAHDRSLTLLPARHRVSGQLPLLAVMILYTFGGLYLLFGA